jgi:hypothetical protein
MYILEELLPEALEQNWELKTKLEEQELTHID